MRRRGLIHRVTYIFVRNGVGQLLLQKRTTTKDLYPGYYDVAAGGVVQAGEGYVKSAARELQEELGIVAPLRFHFDHYHDDGHNRYWGRVFSCQSEGPFRLQKCEVETAQFVAIEPILRGHYQPVTPDTLAVLKRLVNSAFSSRAGRKVR